MYDYLIVGAGLYGAVFAREMADRGKSCLIIDKRSHIGGNIYTKEVEGIHVHEYGAHIFHTNDESVWTYVSRFARFNRYTNSPVANYHGELYNLPFNMNTFSRMWGVITPQEAQAKIDEQKREALAALAGVTEQDDEATAARKIREFTPSNLEEQAISLVGTDIYEKLIKGYTGKQWGRACKELPAFIIKRLPVRFTFDNNYFNALYQGIPIGGYTRLVKSIIGNIPVKLGVDYLEERQMLRRTGHLDRLAEVAVTMQSTRHDPDKTTLDTVVHNAAKDALREGASQFVETAANGRGAVKAVKNALKSELSQFTQSVHTGEAGLGIAHRVIFTGPIDQYFDYCLGALQYRSVRFETEILDTDNYQGNAVINYTDAETPYTRIIEHKHFQFALDDEGNEIPKTVISREYSAEWQPGDEPYYPVNNDETAALYARYKDLAQKETNVRFGGRLGEYKYYDMDQVIATALQDAAQEDQ